MNGEGFVVPIFLRANDVDIGINPGFGGSARAASGFANLLRHGVGRRRGVTARLRRSRGGGDGEVAEGERGGAEKIRRRRMKLLCRAEEKEQSIARQQVEVVEGPYGH